MKRGNFSGFEPKTRYSQTGKRRIPLVNAIVLGAKSFDISIYSKEEQMLDNIDFFEEVPDSAGGLLRFEVQIRKQKIKYIRERNFCEALEEFLLTIPEISFKEFRRYIKRLFLTGDYLQLHNAKERIQNFSPKRADELNMFLESVSEERSLDKVIEEYITNGLDYESILRKLKKLEINPVTIPEEDAKKISHNILPAIPLVLGLLKCG